MPKRRDKTRFLSDTDALCTEVHWIPVPFPQSASTSARREHRWHERNPGRRRLCAKSMPLGPTRRGQKTGKKSPDAKTFVSSDCWLLDFTFSARWPLRPRPIMELIGINIFD